MDIHHTPYTKEVKSFYEYAQEIKWSIPAVVDVYHHANFDVKKIKYLNRIGVPFGNKQFIGEMFDLNLEKLVEGKLVQLIKMLQARRIDAITFERGSIMTTIKKLRIKNIHYTKLAKVNASFGVRKDRVGNKLYKIFNKSVKKVDQQPIFGKYMKFFRLRDLGIVSIK